MRNIILDKPVILRKSLEDMLAGQYSTAIELLTLRSYLTITPNGLEIQPFQKENDLPPVYFSGSEAVILYRQSLGLPDRSIKQINVDAIISSTDTFDDLQDIIFFLREIDFRNRRIPRLRAIDAPLIILRNEDRMLQENVEYLQDNNWNGKPKTVKEHVCDGHGNFEEQDIPRKSLLDINYYLAVMPGMPEPNPDEEDNDTHEEQL